jgi:hypothetical protein
LPPRRLARLGATPDFHHGLLGHPRPVEGRQAEGRPGALAGGRNGSATDRARWPMRSCRLATRRGIGDRASPRRATLRRGCRRSRRGQRLMSLGGEIARCSARWPELHVRPFRVPRSRFRGAAFGARWCGTPPTAVRSPSTLNAAHVNKQGGAPGTLARRSRFLRSSWARGTVLWISLWLRAFVAVRPILVCRRVTSLPRAAPLRAAGFSTGAANFPAAGT